MVRVAVATRTLAIPPVVAAECYSDGNLEDDAKAMLQAVPHLPILDGYWERAGLLRASVLAKGFKATIPDCLVAQSCIDHDIPLITYDRDFRHFTAAGLQLR
ncbi:MAG TPA: PIN domain-containing protein [Thermoanaerobaculia bacterium]|nr:PIN domain-containing protein [Thermoanaerobaculia bacterium]